ncbi:MAG: hypothetical protein ACR2JB_13575 [Bryobacteraceae bacterium]
MFSTAERSIAASAKPPRHPRAHLSRGDEASSTAIIVDPQRDIQQYLAEAERCGLHIATPLDSTDTGGKFRTEQP